MRARATIVVVSALALAGCGGGGMRLSRDAYVAKADAICRSESAKERALAIPASLAAIPAYVDKDLPVVDDGIARLRKLRPPADLDPTVKSWLSSLDQTRTLLSDLKTAAAAGDAAKVQALGAKSTTVAASAHSLAGSIGLDACSRA